MKLHRNNRAENAITPKLSLLYHTGLVGFRSASSWIQAAAPDVRQDFTDSVKPWDGNRYETVIWSNRSDSKWGLGPFVLFSFSLRSFPSGQAGILTLVVSFRLIYWRRWRTGKMFKVVSGGNTVRSAVFGPLCVGLFSALIGVTVATPSVAATVTGYAVKAVSGPLNDDLAGVVVSRPIGNAIQYYIPLNSGTSGIFGNSGACGSGGVGTCSDTGSAGGTLTMNLRFDGVGLGSAILKIVFEDLDLIGVGDPAGFLESVNVLNAAGTTLSGGPITNISSLLVDGNADVQTLVMNSSAYRRPDFSQAQVHVVSQFLRNQHPGIFDRDDHTCAAASRHLDDGKSIVRLAGF